ncbi:hypothetical protein G647_06690 [Cladophialophora carrionii CBS 160.54]|uniref:Uncharacterized protein n=1 Tax=Cladophialophora carrionii CBS 160.54 TaxID=1279043 RepID=V9D6S2_9EURO|nr:uncharacterized protein G647_06690 [Cladophialophora carrionii CBS 160.54]ETI22614.1 hypothetical protein G647_06690 [Cladophialophora carrionii CBS 160.54]
MSTGFGKRRESPQTVLPSLTTVHSDDGRRHGEPEAVQRAETAPIHGGKPSNSLKRKDSAKPSVLSRSDTHVSKRPLVRVPSVQTRYMEMLLHLDEIPRFYNILASLFTWIILAGFLVVPGTFTTFKESEAFQDADNNDDDEVTHAIVHSIANIGLLWLSGAFCIVGALGCLALWFRWRENYVWLINRVFLPVAMNSVAGLVTTLVNIYTAQHGVWSITARITAIVIGACMIVAGLLFALYNFWALRRVRKTHERQMGLEAQHHGETLVEKVKRKAHEPPLQSGSVV